MAIKTAKQVPKKITVTLSSALLARLDEYIPSRKRSLFIAEAIETLLAMEEQLAALDETAGVWSDENHPEMKTEDDIDRWVDGLRATWSPSAAEKYG